MFDVCFKMTKNTFFNVAVERTWEFSFLEGVFGALFAIWSISSHVGVQIGLELVRLIALIGLNKFWTNVTSPKSLKKFSRTTFR